MNFTREIRRDLLKFIPEKRCCKLALLAAVLDTSGYWSVGVESVADGFSFVSEDEEVAEYLLHTVDMLFGIQMTVTEAVRDPKHGRDKLTFSYTGENAGNFADEITDYSPANDLDDCCAQAYLIGAFLGSGSCTLPRIGAKTGYHLEFIFPCDFAGLAAEDFCRLLERFQIIGNILIRGEKYIVYVKSREAISDFLSVIGANSALGTLERVSAAREENNNENRIENCMAGNADRAATASVAQTVAFEKLKEAGMLPALSEPLRTVLEARLAHPAYSLTELSGELGISKSCLNHRIRKLMQIHAERGNL